MNLKYYLRGLGLGLIVTTIILSVSRNFGSGQDDKNNDVSQIQNSTGSVIAFTRGQEETTASMENETRQEETTNQTEPSTEALTQPETTKAAEPETTSKAVEPTTQEPTKAPEENGSVTKMFIMVPRLLIYYMMLVLLQIKVILSSTLLQQDMVQSYRKVCILSIREPAMR